MQDLHINLTEQDYKTLEKLSKKFEVSKSNIIRKLLRYEKYANTVERMGIRNEILAEFLLEFMYIANNINQIAYHLNIDIFEKDPENKIAQYLKEIRKICDETKKEIRSTRKIIYYR